MIYEWTGPGVLGVGRDAVKKGDVLPEKFSGRIPEFLKDGKIKLVPEPEKKPEPDPEPEEKPTPKKEAPKKKAPKSKKVKSK